MASQKRDFGYGRKEEHKTTQKNDAGEPLTKTNLTPSQPPPLSKAKASRIVDP
jgi:hypothetical protein